MKISKKTAFWGFVILLIIALILWAIKDWDKIKRYFSPVIKTKKDAIAYLMTVNPLRNEDKLQSYEDAFLIAWANADKSNEITFQFNGKTHYTATGTVKTN